jgi:hypothetical protein
MSHKFDPFDHEHLFVPYEQSYDRPGYFDPTSGSIGYGPKYGENSYNFNPLHPGPLSDFWGSPLDHSFDPFSPLTPERDEF